MQAGLPRQATPRPIWRQALAELTWRRGAVAAGLAVVAAGALNPIFSTSFPVLLGRFMLIAAVLLFAFSAAGALHPARLPRWLAQVVAVVLAAPIATLLAYLPSTGGDLAQIVDHEGRALGFSYITATVLAVAPLLALGALYRQRDAEARSAQLAFALERSTFEKQALDARLSLLQAQIEPHFLFNTLANVQALVESGSPQAAAVLESLIAYLQAAMPKLHERASTLADELALTRAYLKLMQMRMPDRLVYSIELPDELAGLPFPPASVLTLAENAVRHGVDPSERGGRIDVAVHRAAGRSEVRVVVADSGVGMCESAVPGIGLVNLESRLRGFFGAAARLELHDVAPRGLRAEIVFPAPAPTAP